MTTPTLACTLPTPAQIALAVEDSDYYADILTRLGGQHSPNGIWFMNEVLRIWKARNPSQPLTDREIRILNIAATRFPNAERREDYIRRNLGLSLPRFLYELGQIIDRPEAEAANPTLVRALREQRAARQAARRARTDTPRSAAA